MPDRRRRQLGVFAGVVVFGCVVLPADLDTTRDARLLTAERLLGEHCAALQASAAKVTRLRVEVLGAASPTTAVGVVGELREAQRVHRTSALAYNTDAASVGSSEQLRAMGLPYRIDPAAPVVACDGKEARDG